MTELATIPKNAREEIRVSVDDFKGARLVNIRVWFGDDADKRPGKQGIAFRLDLLPAVLDALKRAAEGQEGGAA